MEEGRLGTAAKRLNLGCGHKRFHMKGWINVDFADDCQPDVQLNLGWRRWPWVDNSVEHARADNLLEHLDNDEFLFCMNEAWRVIGPGGILWLRVPNDKLWPDGSRGDPTHKRFFVDKSFQYWDAACPTYRDYGSVYGFRPWELVKVSDYSAPDPRGEVAKAFFEREYTPAK